MAPPAIVAGSLVVLLSAVVFGVSISGLRLFPPFGGRTQLGRSLDRTGIAPLTDRYVDQVLGPGRLSLEPRLARVGGLQRRAPGVPGVLSDDDFHLPPDNRADAYQVSALPFTGRTSTIDASREPEEPECGPQHGGTVWYRYTATRTDSLLADTFGTGYQNTLAAFRQSSSGLQQLEHGCDFDTQGNSQIKVDVTSGSSYLFQIGAAVEGGELTFHLKRFGSTILASVSTSGESGNGTSRDPSVSRDGRFVAFASQATNLVPGMGARTCLRGVIEEGCFNVFLRDRQAGTTRVVSVGLDGRAADESSRYPQVSDDGRYVLFHSAAADLVSGDTNNLWDAFVRDMRTGRTERVSLGERDEQARPGPVFSGDHGRSFVGIFSSSLSGDGRYVAFQSRSPNLVQGDSDEFSDVFVRDRLEGTTRVVSLDDGGKRSPTDVFLESLSRNGRWIVLGTDVAMSERDGDLSQDFFVRDLWSGATELVSVPESGHELEGHRNAATGFGVSQRSISDDGRFVVFGSEGALVDGDTNGAMDVFVRDRLRQTTERVSVSSSGAEGPGLGIQVIPDWSISGDGNTVAFSTDIKGLEPSDQDTWGDVFVHDRGHRVTLRVTAGPVVPGNGDWPGAFNSRISGDGMHTAFWSWYPLSPRDSNRQFDVFVFSPLPAVEEAVSVRKTSVPTAPCPVSAEYSRVGLSGAHEDVTPALIPDMALVGDPFNARGYREASVVRFKYRIDVSGYSTNPFAQIADVGVELRWDNFVSDYDLYIYDANGEFIAGNNGGTGNWNNGDLLNGDVSAIETELLAQVPHCMDLRVDVVNYEGLPPKEMTLDITLGGLS